MGVRGGEEKGKWELGSRGSVGFVLEFLQGMALERGVRHVLPLGLLFQAFWAKWDGCVLWCSRHKFLLWDRSPLIFPFY